MPVEQFRSDTVERHSGLDKEFQTYSRMGISSNSAKAVERPIILQYRERNWSLIVCPYESSQILSDSEGLVMNPIGDQIPSIIECLRNVWVPSSRLVLRRSSMAAAAVGGSVVSGSLLAEYVRASLPEQQRRLDRHRIDAKKRAMAGRGCHGL